MVFVNNTFSTCTRVGTGADSWLVDSRGPGVKGWGCHPPTPGKMAGAMMPSLWADYLRFILVKVAVESELQNPSSLHPHHSTCLPMQLDYLPMYVPVPVLYYPDEILHFVPFFPITVDKGMFTGSHNYHYSWATGEPGCNEGFFEHTCSF